MFVLIYFLYIIGCVISTNLSLAVYLFEYFYNFIYTAEIVIFVLEKQTLFLNLNNFYQLSPNFNIFFFKLPVFNSDFVYRISFFIFSIYIIYRFFLRSLSFFGASFRREDWFIYQEWFRIARDMSPRDMQIYHRLTSLTTEEFNNVLKGLSLVVIEEEIEDFYYKQVVPVEHRPFKDIYKAIYYYFLAQNEERLARSANSAKEALYYKDRYGPDVFSYLTSNQDDKMAKSSSVKTSRENLSATNVNAKSEPI